MNQDVASKHNLYTQSSPNPHVDMEYARDHALLIAKAMVDFYHKNTTNTWSFGQQLIFVLILSSPLTTPHINPNMTQC